MTLFTNAGEKANVTREILPLLAPAQPAPKSAEVEAMVKEFEKIWSNIPKKKD
jgi:hypothetical protein